ncbi:hypothetical protein [Grimontia sp. NTOU-MAR1]|nr:hypothetical protein [Grimontia sp. NTOU-MAR1]WRV96246.1 hypothetical protein VP504_00065 [Grimontia sp. NTOU-MAR1]
MARTARYWITAAPPRVPTVTITEDANNDGTINDAELVGQVNITVP